MTIRKPEGATVQPVFVLFSVSFSCARRGFDKREEQEEELSGCKELY